MVGSRSPTQEKLTSFVKRHDGKNASSGTFEQTAAFGELVVIATLWAGTKEALGLANPKNFINKTVIDVTNPLDFSKGAPALAVGPGDSAGETVQRMLPGSKVVKAFNIVGNSHMIHPQFDCGPPTMFICGNYQDSKKQVSSILEKFGWETIDLGGIEESRLLEPLAMIWIRYYMNTGNGNHAFKLLRK
jgi:predicted dinucleotide-binding enzyme